MSKLGQIMISVEEYDQQDKWYWQGYNDGYDRGLEQGIKEGTDIAYSEVATILYTLLRPALKDFV